MTALAAILKRLACVICIIEIILKLKLLDVRVKGLQILWIDTNLSAHDQNKRYTEFEQ